MASAAPKKVKRWQWNSEDMEAAIPGVQQEGMPVGAAAREFSVPRKTLDDRLKGGVRPGSNPVPSTVLSSEDETALASYFLYMSKHGFPLTSSMARAYAWAISLRSGMHNRFNKETGPGKHWWESFRARHSELTMSTADNLDRSRASSLSEDVVESYFSSLKSTLQESCLINKPRQTFNCYETFLPLNIATEKVVAQKNAKHVYSRAI